MIYVWNDISLKLIKQNNTRTGMRKDVWLFLKSSKYEYLKTNCVGPF